ncbi:flagellar basal body P-ring protein FlgI, partial [Oleiphilus sp. HI0123]
MSYSVKASYKATAAGIASLVSSFCRSSLLLLGFALVSFDVSADRLKDIANVQGVRSNQLVGYGLVVGLSGTGDNTPFTSQTFRNMMNKFGITIPEG